LEMPVLQGKVSCNKDFAAGRRTKDGAIVADSERKDGTFGAVRGAADLFDEGEFAGERGGAFHPEGRIYGRKRWFVYGSFVVDCWCDSGCRLVARRVPVC